MPRWFRLRFLSLETSFSQTGTHNEPNLSRSGRISDRFPNLPPEGSPGSGPASYALFYETFLLGSFPLAIPDANALQLSVPQRLRILSAAMPPEGAAFLFVLFVSVCPLPGGR